MNLDGNINAELYNDHCYQNAQSLTFPGFQ